MMLGAKVGDSARAKTSPGEADEVADRSAEEAAPGKAPFEVGVRRCAAFGPAGSSRERSSPGRRRVVRGGARAPPPARGAEAVRGRGERGSRRSASRYLSVPG